MLKRISVIVLAAVLVLAQAACGPLSKLNDVLPYVPRVIDYAVSTGRISADLGAKLKDDVSSGNTAVTEVKACLAADVKSNATCYLEFGEAWRVIIARNHVAQANDPKISVVFGLITEIVNLIVRKNTQPEGVLGGPRVTDNQIDAKIKELEREVK